MLSAAVSGEASPTEEDDYGLRYMLDFEMSTKVGSAIVRSGCIVRAEGDFPRFTSCWVLRRDMKNGVSILDVVTLTEDRPER